MATEIPHRYTLKACLYMGSKTDLTTSMSELSKLFPENIESDEKGWKFVNVTPVLVEQIKAVFISDKIKFTENFETTLLWHLGWVIGAKLTSLFLDSDEPSIYFEPQKWKWTPLKGVINGSDVGDDD